MIDGATTAVDTNLENAAAGSFAHLPSGDLHLSFSDTRAVDAGSTAFVTDVPDDIDGEPRDAAPDVGADER